MVSKERIDLLAQEPSVHDFIADAFAHSKLIAYLDPATPLVTEVIGTDKLDDGFIPVRDGKDISKFIQECRKLRFWDRRPVK